MGVITISNLTKDYGNNRGVFDVNIEVRQGEVFGFLGPNGAGKTTTIRNLLGFITPDAGSCKIFGKDCFREAEAIHKNVGYLAGEIAFLDDLTGRQLIDFIAAMKGLKDRKKINDLLERFELDPHGKVRRMSKGMKQKIAIIAAFMSDSEVIILDEPTSGLDPLMQNRFIDMILEEKQRGKTIFMSSHMFEEVEKTCDRTAIIRDGRIVAIEDMAGLAKKRSRLFSITLKDEQAVAAIKNDGLDIAGIDGLKVIINVHDGLTGFIQTLAKYEIDDMDIRRQSLEEVFLHYYGKGGM